MIFYTLLSGDTVFDDLMSRTNVRNFPSCSLSVCLLQSQCLVVSTDTCVCGTLSLERKRIISSPDQVWVERGWLFGILLLSFLSSHRYCLLSSTQTSQLQSPHITLSIHHQSNIPSSRSTCAHSFLHLSISLFPLPFFCYLSLPFVYLSTVCLFMYISH